MARLPVVPPPQLIKRLRGKIHIAYDRGIIVAKKWPRRRPGLGTPGEAQNRALFAQWGHDLTGVAPEEIEAAKILTINTGYVWVDLIRRASLGRALYFDIMGEDGMPVWNVQTLLDQLGTDTGLIIVRTSYEWIGKSPGPALTILAIDPDTLTPEWLSPTDIPDLQGPPGPPGEQGEPGPPGPSGSGIDHPGYISGRMYSVPTSGAYPTVSISANVLHAWPLVVAHDHQFTGVQTAQTSAVGGSQARVGIYTNNNAAPDTLLYDSGAFSIATAAFHTVTGLTWQLDAGIYWIAYVQTNVQSMRGAESGGTLTTWQLGALPAGGGLRGISHVSAAYTFGALPSTFPSATPVETNTPMVWLHG